MNPATASLRPWFTHRRMIPKWIGLAFTGALAFALPAEHRWLLIGVGLLIFFPSEYLVHRGVFHRFAGKPAGRILSKQHVAHHEEPRDLDFIFNDPRISVSIGVLYFAAYYAATRDLGSAGAISFGNFVGLLYYEYTHLTAHRPGVTPLTPWGRYLKKWHLWHHYKNERYWFGVTQPLFDYALGTYRRQDAVEPSPTVRSLVPPAEDAPLLR